MEGLPPRLSSSSGTPTTSFQSNSTLDSIPDNNRVSLKSSIVPHIPRSDFVHQPDIDSIRLMDRAVDAPVPLMSVGLIALRSDIADIVQCLQFVWVAVDPTSDKLPKFLGKLNDEMQKLLFQMAALEPSLNEADKALFVENLYSLQSTLLECLSIPQSSDACLDQARIIKAQFKKVLNCYAGLPDQDAAFNHKKYGVISHTNSLLNGLNVVVEMMNGNLKPATQYLDQADVYLDQAERDVKSLSPFSPCVVQRHEVAIQIEPDIPPPQLASPGIDLLKSVSNVRYALGDVKGELNRGPFDPGDFYRAKQSFQLEITKLGSEADRMESSLQEVMHKSWLPVTFTDIQRGLRKVRNAGGQCLQVICSGVAMLLGRGQKEIRKLGYVASGAISMLSRLISGISSLARNVGFYGGVAFLVPICMVRKGLSSGVPDLMKFPEVEGAPKLVSRLLAKADPENEETFEDAVTHQPAELDIFDPLKNEELRRDMQKSMAKYPNLANVDGVMQSLNGVPTKNSTLLMAKHGYKLEDFESHINTLSQEMSTGHLGLQHAARAEFEAHLTELASLEEVVRNHQLQLSSDEQKFWSEKLTNCWQVVDMEAKKHPSVSIPGNSHGGGSWLERSLGGDSLDDEVIRRCYEPAKLTELFASAREVHDFIRQRLPRLRSRVDPQLYRVLEAELFFQKALLQRQQASADAKQAFVRRFHGKFKPEAVSPSMVVDQQELISRVQKSMRSARDQIKHQLMELMTCEVSSGDMDLKVIQSKEQLIRLQAMIANHLDQADLIAENLQYFIGNDLNEVDISRRLTTIGQELDEMQEKLADNASVVVVLEAQVEEIRSRAAHLKSRLSDLYFQGWVTQEGPGFVAMEDVRGKIRQLDHKLVKLAEASYAGDPEQARQGIIDTLEPLLEGLKKELPNSQRIPWIERVLDYVRDHTGQWSKTCWLELNWLCSQETVNMREPLYRFYPTIQKCARECDPAIQARLHQQIATFRLASFFELKSAVQQVWVEWQRDCPDKLALMMPDRVIQEVVERDLTSEQLLDLRARVLKDSLARNELLAQGLQKPKMDTGAVEQFYQEVLDRLASSSKPMQQRFEAASIIVKERLLTVSLDHYRKIQTADGQPQYPLVVRMAEQVRAEPDLKQFDFEELCQWAATISGKPLKFEEQEEVMMLFMRLRGEVVRLV